MKGYPVISADGQQHLLGYIGRMELRYVLGTSQTSPIRICSDFLLIYKDKAKRAHGASDETPCSFHSASTAHDREALSGLETGPAVADDEETFSRVIRERASSALVDFSPWVSQVHLFFSLYLFALLKKYA